LKIKIFCLAVVAVTICSTSLLGQNFTWTLTSAPTNLTWDSVASSSDGTKLVAVDGPDGIIITSTNSGKNWTQAGSTNLPLSSIWQSIASSSDGTKLVTAEFGIFTSTNSGATWTQASSPQYFDPMVVASSSDGTKLVEAGGGGIFTSTDSGMTWNPTSETDSYYWNSVASSSDGTTLAAVVAFGHIYTSTNSGVTWNIYWLTLNWQSIASSSDGNKLVAVSAGSGPYGTFSDGIYTSSDSGATWTQTSAPHLAWLSVASSSDGTKLAAVVDGGGIYTSTNSGQTWTQTSAPYLGWQSIASSSDGNKLVAAVYGGGIYTGLAPVYPVLSIVQLPNTPPATATPIIVNGFIVGVNMTAPGNGYTVAPAVSFNDVSGHGATAYAQISNGSVTNIVITDAGFGYSSNATINIPAAASLNVVIPSAENLMVGQNYQLQITHDLNNWTSYDSVFTATNTTWTSADFWDVANTNRLFFRLQMLQ
jgi:photosystem II stability/assembly factor-like uncharacterized protein